MLRELQALHVYDTFNLGIQLGLDHGQLRVIEKQSPNDISRQIADVIVEWMKSDRCYCWKRLGEALLHVPEHSNMGLSILKKYVGQPDVDVIVKEFQNNMIKEETNQVNVAVMREPNHVVKKTNGVKLLPRSGGNYNLYTCILLLHYIYIYIYR